MRGQHQGAHGQATVGADGAPGRAGRPRWPTTARTSAWPDEHAAADERGEREQEQPVALEVGDVPGLADAVEVGGVLDVHRVPEDRPTPAVKAGIAFAPPRRSTNSLTIWGMCVPYLA